MENYLNILLKLIKKAEKKQEVPVACLILNEKGKIISKKINNRQNKYNILGHAEINAILAAEKKIKDWRLDKCTMIVSLCPCELCQQVIKEARINKVFYLLDNPKSKKKAKNINKIKNIKYEEEYKYILKNFFTDKR